MNDTTSHTSPDPASSDSCRALPTSLKAKLTAKQIALCSCAAGAVLLALSFFSNQRQPDEAHGPQRSETATKQKVSEIFASELSMAQQTDKSGINSPQLLNQLEICIEVMRGTSGKLNVTVIYRDDAILSKLLHNPSRSSGERRDLMTYLWRFLKGVVKQDALNEVEDYSFHIVSAGSDRYHNVDLYSMADILVDGDTIRGFRQVKNKLPLYGDILEQKLGSKRQLEWHGLLNN